MTGQRSHCRQRACCAFALLLFDDFCRLAPNLGNERKVHKRNVAHFRSTIGFYGQESMRKNPPILHGKGKVQIVRQCDLSQSGASFELQACKGLTRVIHRASALALRGAKVTGAAHTNPAEASSVIADSQW